jgi:hypothetical protein
MGYLLTGLNETDMQAISPAEIYDKYNKIYLVLIVPRLVHRFKNFPDGSVTAVL